MKATSIGATPITLLYKDVMGCLFHLLVEGINYQRTLALWRLVTPELLTRLGPTIRLSTSGFAPTRSYDKFSSSGFVGAITQDNSLKVDQPHILLLKSFCLTLTPSLPSQVTTYIQVPATILCEQDEHCGVLPQPHVV